MELGCAKYLALYLHESNVWFDNITYYRFERRRWMYNESWLVVKRTAHLEYVIFLAPWWRKSNKGDVDFKRSLH